MCWYILYHSEDQGCFRWLFRREEKVIKKFKKIQIEGAVVGFSGEQNNLFTWLDTNSDGFVTFEEGFAIYETIIEDGQVVPEEVKIYLLYIRGLDRLRNYHERRPGPAGGYSLGCVQTPFRKDISIIHQRPLTSTQLSLKRYIYYTYD
jgi:hypothetical protein